MLRQAVLTKTSRMIDNGRERYGSVGPIPPPVRVSRNMRSKAAVLRVHNGATAEVMNKIRCLDTNIISRVHPPTPGYGWGNV